VKLGFIYSFPSFSRRSSACTVSLEHPEGVLDELGQFDAQGGPDEMIKGEAKYFS
jgi:hypothetical protein